jgi:AraC family transcriptional regulator
MDHLTNMIEQHIWMTKEMIERAGELTDEQLDTPLTYGVGTGKTLRSTLSRLVGQLDMWNHAIAGETYGWDVERDEDLADMRDRFAEVAPRFIAEMHDVVSGGRLEETFVNAMNEPARTYTYGALIEHVLTFSATNRTLALLTLQNAGLKDLNFCVSASMTPDGVVEAVRVTTRGARHA